MNIRIITLIALIGLVGCQDRFRYPCQDPANWNNKECQKPECEVSRTCPDLILKTDKRMSEPKPAEPKVDKKGECK